GQGFLRRNDRLRPLTIGAASKQPDPGWLAAPTRHHGFPDAVIFDVKRSRCLDIVPGDARRLRLRLGSLWPAPNNFCPPPRRVDEVLESIPIQVVHSQIGSAGRKRRLPYYMQLSRSRTLVLGKREG